MIGTTAWSTARPHLMAGPLCIERLLKWLGKLQEIESNPPNAMRARRKQMSNGDQHHEVRNRYRMTYAPFAVGNCAILVPVALPAGGTKCQLSSDAATSSRFSA